MRVQILRNNVKMGMITLNRKGLGTEGVALPCLQVMSARYLRCLDLIVAAKNSLRTVNVLHTYVLSLRSVLTP